VHGLRSPYMTLPPRSDLVVAGLMTAALVVVTLAVNGADASGAGAAALTVVTGAGVWWRRRAPIAGGLTIAGAAGLYESVADEASVALLAPLLVGFYSIGAYAPMRRAAAGLAAGLVLTFVGFLGDSRSLGAWLENIVFAALVGGSAWWGGVVVRVNRARTQKLAELAAQLEREREEKARLAVAAERVRIARELHDVVAHAISVIAVQAGAGRHAPPGDPHDTFKAIESTARRALGEMRRLLGLLRKRRRSGHCRTVAGPARPW
jgi:signal transduction histidine kinase